MRHQTPSQYVRRADIPQTGRGDAAAATWIFRGDGCGRDANIRFRPARPRREYSVETGARLRYPAQRAVLYHLYVDDLKTWVKKRSVRGVSDKGCATTCFADLVAIGDEYGRKRLAERGAKLLAKSLNPNEARQRAFVRELEGFLEGVLP